MTYIEYIPLNIHTNCCALFCCGYMISSYMMTSSNGSIFRVTGPLCGEFTGHRWISLTNGTLRLSLIFAWINGWVNNREAGDLRRHRAHYDVTLMSWIHMMYLPIFFLVASLALWNPHDCPTAKYMMTSSNGNIFRVTDLLCGEFTGPRWIPRTKASDAELWSFLWTAPE